MNLRRLYEHLDQDVCRVLHATADAAARDGRGSISVELFLLSLLRDRRVGAVVMKALDDAGADAPAIESSLAGQVAKEPRSAVGALPKFDESLAHLLRDTWSLAFDEYGDAQVSPVRFFEAVARHGDAWPRLVAMLSGFDRLDLASLAMAGGADKTPDAPAAPAASTDLQYPGLSRYGRNMAAAARGGGIDPVVGFRPQMQATASILLRRRQNSAAIVGEAGVGKTACALGFIGALSRGSALVPSVLHGTPVWSLDVSALRAGAVVRGALEERLQAIVKEVEQAGMVLYIDDIHLLFGEQSQGGDALRSILSKGTVRILGTCGWREWRRYIEPDPGLVRRIAPVRIQEPGHDESLRIIEGVAPPLARHHSVEFGENVLDSAVSLSRRYMVGRQLPDKAIVVLDSACARARMMKNVSAGVAGEADDDAAQATGASDSTQTADDAAVGDTVEVVEEDIAAVVSDLTGVPIGGMLSDVSKTAARLEQTLGERVVGQDDALGRCAAQARAYLAGLSDRRRPVGALMFCGPSGVGKTETAHAIAEVLFGGRILTINMSEYQEAHTVSGLKGAPAGYVGYGEGGVLTEGIRRTPYCVVLLDEIEKAHADVIKMLYQVLDRGWMEDAEGIEADFSNALIILTTNAGDTIVEKAAMADSPPLEDDFHRSLTGALARYFPAAFIGRLQLVPYWPLGQDTLAKIAGMRLDRLVDVYRASHRSELTFDDEVVGWLAERVKTTPQGARVLDGIIARSIRPVIAEYVLDKLGAGQAPGNAIVHRRDGEFAVRAAEDT
jgi:ATP-dependent Clp protease ATP-binding subunit ClpA